MSDYEHEQPLVDVAPVWRERAGDTARRVGRFLSMPWVSYLLAFAIAFGAYLEAFKQFRYQGPTGDEPSYVIDAISMARDQDRDLSNNFSYTNTAPLIRMFAIPAIPHGNRWTD